MLRYKSSSSVVLHCTFVTRKIVSYHIIFRAISFQLMLRPQLDNFKLFWNIVQTSNFEPSGQHWRGKVHLHLRAQRLIFAQNLRKQNKEMLRNSSWYFTIFNDAFSRNKHRVTIKRLKPLQHVALQIVQQCRVALLLRVKPSSKVVSCRITFRAVSFQLMLRPQLDDIKLFWNIMQTSNFEPSGQHWRGVSSLWMVHFGSWDEWYAAT